MQIRVLRKTLGLSQKELADKLSIERTTVTKWESGKSNPRAELLPKIARILNCTVDELLQTEPMDHNITDSQTSGKVENKK